MNKYTELSDFEINRRIAEMDTKNRYVYFEKEQTIFRKFNNGQTQKFNPCNYPADAMQIIIENRIALFPMETLGVQYWCAASNFEDIGERELIWGIEANNKNPLRAAMETYLLMKDAENEINNKR